MAPITDDEWADLVAHELPKTSDRVIQTYLESRRALMAQDEKHRSDYSFRHALSPIAKKACDFVSRIRGEERRAVSSPNRQATSKSWQIIRRMPKGALLRAHCYALADMNHVIDIALHTPGLCISCPTTHLVTAEARKEAGLCIQFRDSPHLDHCSLWTDDYKPGTFIPLAKAADSYPEGGRRGFVEWLKGRCMIPRPEINLRARTEAASGDSDLVGGMLSYEPLWRAFLQRLMSNLVDDGISWLELRLTFPLVYYREGSEMPDPDYDHMFKAVEEEVAKFQTADPGRQFWGLRVVWSTMHGQDPRSIIEDADDCIATKLVWPHLLAGYDLADSGNLGRPLADSLPELFWFRKQCAVEDVQIPLFLSAGGSRGHDGGDSTTEGGLFDALLLGTRRIGHATSLCRHTRLIEAFRDKRILVEICPNSKEGLDPTVDVAMHHSLSTLLTQGVPCALCDDDSKILLRQEQNVGSRMTDIFWQVLHGCDGADLATLGSLAENSVRWAAFEDQDAETWARDIRAASVGAGVKAARLQQWAVEWERFCLWVVTEYGDAYDGGDDGQADATE